MATLSEQVAALEKTISDMTGATTHALKKVAEKYELEEDAFKCFQFHFKEYLETEQTDQEEVKEE